MARRVYEMTIDKECPRCGSDQILVSVYHFGTTHKPRCKECGLSNNKGDHEDLVVSTIKDAYYQYEENHHNQ